jgi:hypothetical protein
MDSVTETVLQAALTASYNMGDDLLKMSCFVSNWVTPIATKPRRKRK